MGATIHVPDPARVFWSRKTFDGGVVVWLHSCLVSKHFVRF